MEEEKPNFVFGKKLGLSEQMIGNIPFIIYYIKKLLFFMKETNAKQGLTCEFFRIDFRHQTINEQLQREFPLGALIIDLKFGSPKEWDEKHEKEQEAK